MCLPPVCGTADVFFRQLLDLSAVGYRVISVGLHVCTVWLMLLCIVGMCVCVCVCVCTKCVCVKQSPYCNCGVYSTPNIYVNVHMYITTLPLTVCIYKKYLTVSSSLVKHVSFVL